MAQITLRKGRMHYLVRNHGIAVIPSCLECIVLVVWNWLSCVFLGHESCDVDKCQCYKPFCAWCGREVFKDSLVDNILPPPPPRGSDTGSVLHD